MKEIRRILVTRTGNGASFSSNHKTLSEVDSLVGEYFRSARPSYHVTIQIDYINGECDILSNY